MAGSSDRGQAYTLEALVAALLLVTAVLFALQAVVITPTSAGQDRDVVAQQQQVASDLLTTAANDGELSRLARYWDCSADDRFADAGDTDNWIPGEGYPSDEVPIEDFGSALNQTFDAGTRYNVELVYASDGDQNVSRIVYQGTPGSDVVTASHTIALTDDQLVTGPNADDETIAGCDSMAPIPDEHSSSEVYNVVEVRVVLW